MKHPFHGPDPKDGRCMGCKEKLSQVHPFLQSWFWNQVVINFKDAHVSWGWRDEKTQNDMVARGASKEKWPTSRHNFMQYGKPCALAIDLFEIGLDGVGKTTVPFCTKVYQIAQASTPQIQWGGNYLHFKDFDHYFIDPAKLSD